MPANLASVPLLPSLLYIARIACVSKMTHIIYRQNAVKMVLEKTLGGAITDNVSKHKVDWFKKKYLETFSFQQKLFT